MSGRAVPNREKGVAGYPNIWRIINYSKKTVINSESVNRQNATVSASIATHFKLEFSLKRYE
jgi:hypothetical protein